MWRALEPAEKKNQAVERVCRVAPHIPSTRQEGRRVAHHRPSTWREGLPGSPPHHGCPGSQHTGGLGIHWAQHLQACPPTIPHHTTPPSPPPRLPGKLHRASRRQDTTPLRGRGYLPLGPPQGPRQGVAGRPAEPKAPRPQALPPTSPSQALQPATAPAPRPYQPPIATAPGPTLSYYAAVQPHPWSQPVAPCPRAPQPLDPTCSTQPQCLAMPAVSSHSPTPGILARLISPSYIPIDPF